MTRPYDAGAHWEWLCRLPEFESAIDVRRKVLKRRRHGRPLSNFGPGQLLEHASNSDAAARLLGSIMDPRRSELAGVLPKSHRPLLWLALLGVEVRVKPGGASLHPKQRDRLQAVSLKRLRRERLSDRDRQFVHRMLARLDSGDDIEVELPRREHFAAANWDPTAGEAVALSATAGMQGRPVLVPSLAGYPVVGEVVRTDAHAITFKL